MDQPWSPKRSLAEGKSPLVSPFSVLQPLHTLVNDLLCAPGQLHELQTILISGQLHRVYKNLMPSLRAFWLWAAQEHKDAIYLVFENQRFTFAQIFERSAKAASIFRDVYNIRKGLARLTLHTMLVDTESRR